MDSPEFTPVVLGRASADHVLGAVPPALGEVVEAVRALEGLQAPAHGFQPCVDVVCAARMSEGACSGMDCWGLQAMLSALRRACGFRAFWVQGLGVQEVREIHLGL